MRGSRKFCQRGSKFGPSSARQRNAIEMAFRWRADDGPTLNASLVALCQGIRTSIAQKPYIFVIFQGGPDPRVPPPPGPVLLRTPIFL